MILAPYYPSSPSYSSLFAGAGAIEVIDGIPSDEAWGVPAFVNATQTALFFNGVPAARLWIESTGSIEKTLSADRSFSFEMLFVSGDTRPVPGDEVEMFWEGVKRFGGLIQSVKERAIQGVTSSSILTIECNGYEGYADRKVIAQRYESVGTVGIILLQLVADHLSIFGVTYVPEDAGDNVPDQLFHYVYVREALNRLRDQLTGFDWWIDENKQLHFRETVPTTPNAPFTLRNGDVNTDAIEVTTSAVKFRNRQFVLPSQDLIALSSENTTAVNGQNIFPTNYPLVEKPIIFVNGVEEAVSDAGVWDSSPWYWYENVQAAFRLPSAPPFTGGEVINIQYRSTFPVAVVAEDAGSIADKGLYEAIYQAKNLDTLAGAQAMTEALLDMYGTDGDFPQEITFEYNSHSQSAWLDPGMVVDVDRTFPTALGNFTVERVSSDEEDGKLWRHTVTLRNGNGDVTDELAKREFLTSARVGISSPPVRAEWSLFKTLPGITNPGAATGVVSEFVSVQVPGTIDSWTLQSLTDPPTGADLIIDILLNGTSIFAAGNANKAVLPAGRTDQVSGIRFVTDNMPVVAGDVLTLNTLQVGSINAGKNVKLALNIRSGQAQ